MNKTKKPRTWDDVDLSTRARQAIRNLHTDLTSAGPDGLIKALKEKYDETVVEMLRVPNCGRQTVNEIFDELDFTPPKVERSISKFVSPEDLLKHIKVHGGIEPEKLDRSSLVHLAHLIAKNYVMGTEGIITISPQGDDLLEEAQDQEIVELTIKGTRAQVRRFIENLPDDHAYLDVFETEGYRQLAEDTKAVVVLDG